MGAGCNTASSPVTTTGMVGQTSAAANTIKIGAIMPLTGDAAVEGLPSEKVVRLAVDQINEKGGIDGKQLQLIVEDGKCDGQDAANAMQKLVSVDGVKVVIGGLCSSESLAAAPIANANHVLLFSPSASSPELTTKGGHYFLRDYPSDASQGKVLADVAYNKKGLRKIAIIEEQNDYPMGVADAFIAEFEKLGGNVQTEQFAPEVTDFRTTLTKLRLSNPDALFVSTQAPKASELILSQVKELNWEVPLIGVDIVAGSDLPKAHPDLVEGMLVAEFGYDASSTPFQNFVSAYKAKYNEDPQFLSYAQTEYDAVNILADAIKAVGYDSDKILAWLHGVQNWPGISGPISFDSTDGDRSVGIHRPEIITGGKAVPFNG